MMDAVTAVETPLPPPSARSLLLTVLGELVYPDDAAVPTAALMRVMGGLGVEEHASRQAIARCAAGGWLDSERHGRAARWRLAAHGRELIEDGMRRSAAFVEKPPPWDGRWLILLVAVPQALRATRKRLYGGLSWLGLGNPTPGLWVTPHAASVDGLRALVAELGLGSSALGFVGVTQDIGMNEQDIVRAAWDLTDLAARYERLLARFTPLAPAGGDDLLLIHLELLNLLQRFLRLDPQLPEQLLPDWIGRRGAELFKDRRERWTAPALDRWREIVSS
jgi:phenylacetic acid degradation operon negative regulatory protein